MVGVQGSIAPAHSASADDPIRVMVVDDALVVRGMLSRMLEGEADISVVASAGDGARALAMLARHPLDVVVLDIEMPTMDGLEALPKIVDSYPNVQVIMASTLTARNAKISLKAMELGAADYVTKPGSTGEMQSASDFKRELIDKVRSLGRAGRRKALRGAGRTGGTAPAAAGRPSVVGARTPLATPRTGPSASTIGRNSDFTLRPLTLFKPDALAIGSSTGGPQALLALLKDVGAVTQPIFITQHMPATFTTILADHIRRVVGRSCQEGEKGMVVQSGCIYLAPGDNHMIVKRSGVQTVISLSQGPPENFCRPAVDPMLRSLASVYGKRLLTTILTGMGSDGAEGCKSVVAAGGQVLAQDEATSVVWGMPGAAAAAGVCGAVLPLEKLGPEIRRFALSGGRP